MTLAGALGGWFERLFCSPMTPLMNVVVRDTGESVRLRALELSAELNPEAAPHRAWSSAHLRWFGRLVVASSPTT